MLVSAYSLLRREESKGLENGDVAVVDVWVDDLERRSGCVVIGGEKAEGSEKARG